MGCTDHWADGRDERHQERLHKWRQVAKEFELLVKEARRKKKTMPKAELGRRLLVWTSDMSHL